VGKKRACRKKPAGHGDANLGFEAKLWLVADRLLARLLSGELRMADAEPSVEEVA